MTTNRTKILSAGATLGVALTAVLLVQKTVLNGFIVFLQSNPATLPLLAVSGVLAYKAWRRADTRTWSYRDTKDVPSQSIRWHVIGSASAFLLASSLIGVLGSWMADLQYVKSMKVVTDPSPTYQDRTPFHVAKALAPSAVRTNGSLNTDTTTYIPQQGHWSSIVDRRSWLGGHTEIIDQNIAKTGKVATTNCAFDGDAGRSLGGLFTRNLERKIIGEAGYGIKIDATDAYGYCKDGAPFIVVPLTSPTGFLPAIETPAGVALYNGSTGDVDVIDNPRQGQVPGPVYPLSLAHAQREATLASGSILDWMFNRVGYDATGQDEGDPNADNNGEFTLARTDGQDFVTPLTRRGRGTAIVAVGTVDAGTSKAGRLNDLLVHTLPEQRPANTALVDQMKGTFTELSWATPGFGVFEVIPNGPDQWVASLGLRQNVTHRVGIAGDGTMCLFTATGTKIRCSSDAPATPGQVDDGTGTPVPVGSDLAKLSDADLANLNRQVAAEVAKRLAQG